jgi:SAM-dependent methyltransferase
VTPPDGDPVDRTIQSYDTALDRYLSTSGPPSGDVRDFLSTFADLVDGGLVLELGSGPGWDAEYLEGRGLRVSRTDVTPGFIERLRAAGHDVRLLDARSDDFGGPYDGVLADAVLLHLSREQFVAALRTARASVVDGGVLALTLKEGDGEGWSTAKLDLPRHFTYWRAAAVSDALASTAWTVVSIEHFSGRLEPWLFVIARAAATP